MHIEKQVVSKKRSKDLFFVGNSAFHFRMRLMNLKQA